MSPLNRRRLANFRANRRGWYAFWIFLLLFGLSLMAEFIANERPILFVKGGELYMPVLFVYTEVELGGELPTEADYRDTFVQKLIEDDSGWMLWPPIRYSHNTINWSLDVAPAPPSREHWLGTESLGRDIVAQLLYGFRLSVLFGLSLTLMSSIIGITVGAVQGYFGGIVDLIGQRFVEIWAALPLLFLMIILASLIEPNFFWLLGLLTLFGWMALVGVVRAEFLRARNFEFVRAARALGVSNRRIIVRHVLPNAMVAALTYLPFLLNGSIATLTALDFLGFGMPYESPSLGRLLGAAQSNLQAPWIAISVFLTIATLLTLLIFIGEAIRDALDPRRTLGVRAR